MLAEVQSDRTSLGESRCGGRRRRQATIRSSSAPREQICRAKFETHDLCCPAVRQPIEEAGKAKKFEPVQGSFSPMSELLIRAEDRKHHVGPTLRDPQSLPLSVFIVRWHLQVGIIMSHRLHQQALVSLACDNGFTTITTVHPCIAGIESQATFLLLRSMTVLAMFDQYRSHACSADSQFFAQMDFVKSLARSHSATKNVVSNAICDLLSEAVHKWYR